MLTLGWAHAGEAVELRFPSDIVFVHRTLGGHFGNLGRLRATARWRDIVLAIVERAEAHPSHRHP